MTLLRLLAAICFISYPILGIRAGGSAGISGIMLGAVIGLILCGLAYTTLRFTFEYSDKYREKSNGIKWLIDNGTGLWILIVLGGAAGLTHYLTETIVRLFSD